MDHLLTFDTLAAFATLLFLEMVLSVDNIVFVAVAAGRLPPERRAAGRQLGLWLALVLRVAMLCAIVWLTRLDVTLFRLAGRGFSIKDVVLIAGGLFLLYKGASEIHDDLDAPGAEGGEAGNSTASLAAVVAQIGVVNIVFSLDSVITAVGMSDQLVVMVAAVTLATLAMMVASKPVGEFIEKRPTAKMLALSFILLVGVALIAEGTGFHVPRGYLYFAIAFSLFVEVLNGARRGQRRPHGPA